MSIQKGKSRSSQQVDDRLIGDDPFEGIDTESEFKFKPKDEFEDVKIKKVEFALPIALDRPNTLRISNKQGLFRFQFRINQLPLYFSIAANGKTHFKSYISLTSMLPDHDLFDITFEGSLLALRMETLRNCLEEMLKDKDRSKRDEMEKVIKGEHLAKKDTGSRTKKSQFFAQRRPSPERSPDDQGLLSDDGKPQSTFMTLPKEKIKRKASITQEQPLLARVLQDEKLLADVLIPLTIRIYSTCKVVVLTVSGNKQNTKKVEKLKPEELFSTQRAEEINKSIVKSTLEIRKFETARSARKGPSRMNSLMQGEGPFSMNSNSAVTLNNREVELVEGPDGKQFPILKKLPSERILLNKKIAAQFMDFRLTQFSLLARKNATDVPLHLERAQEFRRTRQEDLRQRVEAIDVKRELERQQRIEREYLSRVVPLKANWVVLVRFATILEVVKDRFLKLKLAKKRAQEITRKVMRIQMQVRRWLSNNKPPRSSYWRFVDVKLHFKAHIYVHNFGDSFTPK